MMVPSYKTYQSKGTLASFEASHDSDQFITVGCVTMTFDHHDTRAHATADLCSGLLIVLVERPPVPCQDNDICSLMMKRVYDIAASTSNRIKAMGRDVWQ